VSIITLQEEYRGGIDVLVDIYKELQASQDVAEAKKVRECQEKISELQDCLISESKERYKLAKENEVLEMKMQEMKNDYERWIRDLTPFILTRD
jgi:hypothetical protein